MQSSTANMPGYAGADVHAISPALRAAMRQHRRKPGGRSMC